MNINNMNLEELLELKQQIEVLMKEKQNTVEPLIIELYFNRYKGSGKCWIANVDPKTKKILNFVDAESVQKRDSYSGKKTFAVTDGYYLFCESGSKSTDSRIYYKVENGEMIQF